MIYLYDIGTPLLGCGYFTVFNSVARVSPAGSFLNESCTCPPGMYGPFGVTVYCRGCAQHSTLPCTACPQGQYCDTSSPLPIECPANAATKIASATSIFNCICVPSYHGIDPSNCTCIRMIVHGTRWCFANDACTHLLWYISIVCAAGSYCPDNKIIKVCPKGAYCPAGNIPDDICYSASFTACLIYS